MSKPAMRSYSRYAKEAAELLGHMIRSARIEREMTISEVAERAGVSRGLVHRIESGDMGCSLGVAFEVAAIVGVRLFDEDPSTLTQQLALTREKLTLLPRSVRQRTTVIHDDF